MFVHLCLNLPELNLSYVDRVYEMISLPDVTGAEGIKISIEYVSIVRH